MPAFNLETCARPNILQLVPYRCARDDYKDDGTNILLDANENAYGPSLPSSSVPTYYNTLHRYPDPHQTTNKQLLCDLRNSGPSRAIPPPPSTPPLDPTHLFLGVGSDECIDALLRAFCTPGTSKILVCPPTYGMYTVSAQINDIAVLPIPLTTSFDIDAPAICAALTKDPNIKIIYLCTPGNPTGTLVAPEAVRTLLQHPTWNGVLVLDEAYIDFAAPESSLASWVPAFPNLVVMQTLSKAFGLAGIRLGAAFTAAPIARVLNSLKAPYSISEPTAQIARAALSGEGLAVMRRNVGLLAEQRERLRRELPRIEGVGRFRGGWESNFVLVEMLDAQGRACNRVAGGVYERLAEERNVVVRFRGREQGCEGCLRITVGTEEENGRLLERLREVLVEVRAGS